MHELPWGLKREIKFSSHSERDKAVKEINCGANQKKSNSNPFGLCKGLQNRQSMINLLNIEKDFTRISCNKPLFEQKVTTKKIQQVRERCTKYVLFSIVQSLPHKNWFLLSFIQSQDSGRKKINGCLKSSSGPLPRFKTDQFVGLGFRSHQISPEPGIVAINQITDHTKLSSTHSESTSLPGILYSKCSEDQSWISISLRLLGAHWLYCQN